MDTLSNHVRNSYWWKTPVALTALHRATEMAYGLTFLRAWLASKSKDSKFKVGITERTLYKIQECKKKQVFCLKLNTYLTLWQGSRVEKYSRNLEKQEMIPCSWKTSILCWWISCIFRSVVIISLYKHCSYKTTNVECCTKQPNTLMPIIINLTTRDRLNRNGIKTKKNVLERAELKSDKFVW